MGKQTCTKCGQRKAMTAFRRQSANKTRRDTICKACRKKHDAMVKAMSFGPLPEPEGSREWVEEIWRRAEKVRRERYACEKEHS